MLLAVAWLRSLVDESDWSRRKAAAIEYFDEARTRASDGSPVDLFDPQDTVTWLLLQAETYASDRRYIVPAVSSQIASVMTRIGQNMERVFEIDGVETRARRLMTSERRQPQSGLFEILVALGYALEGWDVAFVPETPGRGRTHDLTVRKGRRKWAAECKRLGRTQYDKIEAAAVEAILDEAHRVCADADVCLTIDVAFTDEVQRLDVSCIADRVRAYLSNRSRRSWSETGCRGRIERIDFGPLRYVLNRDDVYFGSSRMLELLTGNYQHQLRYSFRGRWRPATGRPLYADAVYRANVIRWQSTSDAAVIAKGRHFRSIVSSAIGQLPSTMPGIVHIGVETWNGFRVDANRHIANFVHMRTFDPVGSRLRWVLGHYFAPEETASEMESAATEETVIPYRIGRHSTENPLPGRLLLSDDSRPGVHWVANP